jgi:N-formylglutamate deformylase
MNTFGFHQGALPLLISIPHAGTQVPEEIGERFTTTARRLPDTDWCVQELYEFAQGLGASIITANYSRYVVDLNRSADSSPLYESYPTSPVCPTHTFSGEPIYRSGMQPDQQEVDARIEEYWQPYHSKIAAELARMASHSGFALLWDAHSVASEIPGLFAGVLPEFNLGTRDHASCPREIGNALLDLITTDGRFGAVLNGRFRGGYITSHHARPDIRIYAVQLELAQRVYMEESVPEGWDRNRAEHAIVLIERLLRCFVELAAVRQGSTPASDN